MNMFILMATSSQHEKLPTPSNEMKLLVFLTSLLAVSISVSGEYAIGGGAPVGAAPVDVASASAPESAPEVGGAPAQAAEGYPTAAGGGGGSYPSKKRRVARAYAEGGSAGYSGAVGGGAPVGAVPVDVAPASAPESTPEVGGAPVPAAEGYPTAAGGGGGSYPSKKIRVARAYAEEESAGYSRAVGGGSPIGSASVDVASATAPESTPEVGGAPASAAEGYLTAAAGGGGAGSYLAKKMARFSRLAI
uniref:Uncharacterized protein n=2 Tax=Caenorhabditis japonica TaxID=281687 RepID=A0A8R1HRN1_CAEJA